MEGDLIKKNEWLMPLSLLYGIGVGIRNKMFDWGILKQKSYDIPVICVGNITVGGTGKTPHTEYLIRLLKDKNKIAVLSRGYKRKTSGFILANSDSTMEQIGDEPYQMHCKFKDIVVAVDPDRRHGIAQILQQAPSTDVILLDDAYQHRYVKAGINILLVDYHRMITEDCLLPAGRMREPLDAKNRANIVIVTKCPDNLKPMDYRVVSRALKLFPFQKLYFTTFKYGSLNHLYSHKQIPLNLLNRDFNTVLLLTGIASPLAMKQDLQPYAKHIVMKTFDDHHYFGEQDVEDINHTFAAIEGTKIIITTEKDATRLQHLPTLSNEVRDALYTLPIEVEFLVKNEDSFNNYITSYVHKNSRNSVLAKNKNANSAHNSNNFRNRIR